MEKTSHVTLSQIGQINLNVRDMDKAVAFYKDTLGMKLLFAMENMAFFNCDGVKLMLSLPENDQFDHPGSVIYFNTEDIMQAYKQFKSNGVSFVDQPHMIADMGSHEVWMAFFKDLDDNTLALMSEVAK
ncbi:VOC family protein [Pseudalkalibacillus berkeleyi]|uniref:VOC family protein n=1 Tax=Pseudalkalibacillus berkeleyi TaxID=1069813 RepID=A0ABS9H3C9_9BACL|nr:VOC family protein [Pseudalkalibacillus berkeleyi]MCF6138465.1 VOC family protein [Pseudalkalibacillus berkeleyi]